MKLPQILLGLAVLIVLVVLSGVFFTVDETEQVIVLQFGQPVGEPVTDAGLHLKLPLVQNIVRFEKRVMEWDGDANQISTEDKRYLWVNTFARWRISDPLKFFQSMNNELAAQNRLDDIINGVTRDVITENKLIEAVRNSNRPMMAIGEDSDELVEITNTIPIVQGRNEIIKQVLARAQQVVPQYGIELLDVRIKHINYIKDVQQKVYERMISERTRIAEKFRSEGQGERAKIDGDRQKELQRIESEAYRRAQEIQGEADAEAAKIYADAYGRDPEFYTFIKTLESYRETLKKNSTVILKTDSDYLRYLKRASGR